MNPPKGHPKGLYLLFVTEMWERFSYYGMRALFMLYMVQALLFDKELASQVYGSYTGLVYLTPLIGGYIADRYWGNRRSIVTGALTMAVGQFLLFLSACYYHEVGLAKYLMFCGLGLLILGNGFFKPNISTMVGRLYRPDDSRKDSAFTIFYMGVNVGSTLAPLICGLIGNTGHPEDFKWGFLAACIGMLLGAAVFRIFMNRYICDPDGNPVGTAPARSKETTEKDEKKPSNTGRTVLMVAFTLILTILFSVNWGHTSDGVFAGSDWIGSLIYATVIVMPIIIITDKSLTRTEQARIGVIYIIAFFVIFFWSAYEQAGASLTFFADEQTDRRIGNWERLCRHLVIPGQTRMGTQLPTQTVHRSVTAFTGVSLHRLRGKGHRTGSKGKHGLADRSLPDSYHGRIVSGSYRPVTGIQALTCPFLFATDGCMVPQYFGCQQVCRIPERFLSGTWSQ